jgi:hypothetical protein
MLHADGDDEARRRLMFSLLALLSLLLPCPAAIDQYGATRPAPLPPPPGPAHA